MRTLARVLLVLVLLATAAAAGDWVPLVPGAEPGAPPAVRTLASDVNRTLLEVRVPGFWAENTPHGVMLRLPGLLVSTDYGRPELPMVGCNVALPRAVPPAVTLREADYLWPGQYQVRMAPALERDTEINVPPAPVAPDRAYPDAPAAVTHTGYWRDVPLCTLQIHAFRASGDGNVLWAATRMVLEVNHGGMPGAWPTATLPSEMKPLLDSLAVNGAAVPTAEPQLDAPATEYLVIANSALAAAVQPLVDWRREQGYVTELVSTTSTSPPTIKSYIQTRYAQAKLKWVLLVGEYAHIPWYMWNNNRSDSWYACLTGGTSPDLYPDVGLGRLSGNSAAEITHQVSRILAYEKNPPAGSWFDKIVLTAHQESGATGRFTTCCESIASGPLATSGWTTIKQYGYQTGVSNATLSSYINSGAGILFYRGHGSSTSWSSWCKVSPTSFTTSNVAGLTHGAMTPLVFSICCSTGDFSVATCFTEQWLRASAGAVACVGATNVTYTSGNTPMAIEFCRAIFGDGTTDIAGFHLKGITQALAVGGSGGQYAAYLFYWMGDSFTSVWARDPYTMGVNHPSSIHVGGQSVEVSVRRGLVQVVGARVCLLKDNEVFAVGTTDLTGKVSLPVAPASAGTMKITVTAKNCRPYQGQIAVHPASANIIPLPAFGQTYSASMTRGFYCLAPCDFTVVGLRVPDEAKHGLQNVCLYKHTAAPPAYSGTVPLTPLFSRFLEPSTNIIPCSIPYKNGETLIVIGACGDATGLKNSYAATAGPVPSHVLGQPTSLYRCGVQSNIITATPPHAVWSENSGNVSRVEVYVKASSGFVCDAPDTAALGVACPIDLSGGPVGRTIYYQIAASLGCGTRINVGPCALYLDVDPVFVYSVFAGPPIFSHYAGTLVSGNGAGKFVPPLLPALVGLSIYHAAVAFDAKTTLGCTLTDRTVLTK
ncbi:MAG: hypothetical protein JXQ29_00635 [Planctomycetes bacterium]|nr:hypothetical protein [Planctomycetota bacterium]